VLSTDSGVDQPADKMIAQMCRAYGNHRRCSSAKSIIQSKVEVLMSACMHMHAVPQSAMASDSGL